MTRTHSSDDLTDDDRRRIRLRRLLNRRLLLVMGLCIAMVAVGGWLAYEPHVAPATVEDSEPTGTWTEEPTLSHGAEVQRANPVFPVGETLHNEGLYYTQVSPDLNGTYAYAYDAPNGEVDVEVDVFLVLQSVDDDGNAYWTERESLQSDSVEGLQPGEDFDVAFDVNVSDIEPRIESIERGLGASPGTTETIVIVETTVTGTVNDEGVSNRHTGAYDLEVSDSTYTVETDTEDVAERTFTETVEVEEEYGPLRSYGPLALVVFGLVGTATLGYGRYAGVLTVTDDERRLLEAASQREEFDDWISVGRVTEADLEGPRIEVADLEGLVDVAIDSDRRVIEDRETGAYYVVEGDVYHVYEPVDPTLGGDSLESVTSSTAADDDLERESRAVPSNDAGEVVEAGVLVGDDSSHSDDAGDRPFFERGDSEDPTRGEVTFGEQSAAVDEKTAEASDGDGRPEDSQLSSDDADSSAEAVDTTDGEAEETG